MRAFHACIFIFFFSVEAFSGMACYSIFENSAHQYIGSNGSRAIIKVLKDGDIQVINSHTGQMIKPRSFLKSNPETFLLEDGSLVRVKDVGHSDPVYAWDIESLKSRKLLEVRNMSHVMGTKGTNVIIKELNDGEIQVISAHSGKAIKARSFFMSNLETFLLEDGRRVFVKDIEPVFDPIYAWVAE